jgi:N-methylhydantoinase A
VIGSLAAKLNRTPEETAEGALTVLNSNMANAIRSRTVQKGIDPRDFTLCGFGGAGPLHAAEVAGMLGMRNVLIPPHPGITSAVGLLTSDLEYHALRTAFAVKGAIDLSRLQSLFDDMEEELRGVFTRDNVPADKVRMLRHADLRYVGQGYELKIDIPDGKLTEAALGEIWQAFHERHRAEYGHAFEASPIEIVTVKVRGLGLVDKLSRPPSYEGAAEPRRLGAGKCVFRVDDRLETFETPHLERGSLPVEHRFSGPAILLQKDSTTVVPPGWTYWADRSGNVRMTREQA